MSTAAETPQSIVATVTELQETAVALCINGVCQAVMMATPGQLDAFAIGFFISEGVITDAGDILSVDSQQQPQGWQVDVTVLAACEHQLKARKRVMAGPSGCGLCGIDSLQAAMDTQGLVNAASPVLAPRLSTIEHASQSLNSLQKQHQHGRGHHSAAMFNAAGEAVAISEDVGRHSALDKLIGQLTLAKQPLDNGFAIVTSRCSHDLVIKSLRAGLRCLVTLAPPTDLAVQSATQLGLLLFCYQQAELKRFA
ncbi:Sulfur carrier protein FdhD [Sinobacterium norvegicum]|uniref:Sulfur carrier protein FdhD n=1 Tax=Sinobacterium norvegicum TaxID=1641715 RepID=A0ABN8EFA1_9GAMM|nr:formate dehydrogenase accessory sulfurtransferase FdhD [Sinobacterium norvegicum]CAH0991018.1 Sulfur carrier protein FdhD [Sinobacterium norvegicum]